MRLIYLAVLAGCLLVTLPLELALGVRVYRQPARWIAAVVMVAAPFVAWDLYAIAHHQWWYDPRQTLGVDLPGDLPLEELAFFFVIPTCAILALEAVRARTGWLVGDEPARVSGGGP
jgi:lycopene cyclase domain-containing protein